jgi:hypothetical protein
MVEALFNSATPPLKLCGFLTLNVIFGRPKFFEALQLDLRYNNGTWWLRLFFSIGY